MNPPLPCRKARVTMGEVRTISRKPRGESFGGSSETVRRRTVQKQFTVQGWNVKVASSRYLIRQPVEVVHGFKSQSDHQGDLVLGKPKVAKFLVG